MVQPKRPPYFQRNRQLTEEHEKKMLEALANVRRVYGQKKAIEARWRANFHAAVVAAAETGAVDQEIADMAGLSRQRIYYLLREEREKVIEKREKKPLPERKK